MSIAEDVERFIVDEIASGAGVESIAADEDLLGQELIDSLGITELVAFLEQRYGVRIGDEDLVPEHFQTINDVVALVRSKGG